MRRLEHSAETAVQIALLNNKGLQAAYAEQASFELTEEEKAAIGGDLPPA